MRRGEFRVWELRRCCKVSGLLGGSGVVISRVISRVTILLTHIRGLITLLVTTPEPPSRVQALEPGGGLGFRVEASLFRLQGSGFRV